MPITGETFAIGRTPLHFVSNSVCCARIPTLVRPLGGNTHCILQRDGPYPGERPYFMPSQVSQTPKTGIPSVLFPALPDNQSAGLMALAFQLERSQWWSTDEMSRAQASQLRELILFARRESPFYREHLKSIDVAAFEDATLEAFVEIPMLTRQLLQDAGQDMHVQTLPAGHRFAREISTAGSTGSPVKIGSTNITALFFMALHLRLNLWARRDFRHTVAAVKMLRGKEVEMSKRGQAYSNWASGFETGPMYLCDTSQTLQAQLSWLVQCDPHILLVYPSNLMDLLRLSEETGLRPNKLVSISTMSEALPDALRRICDRVWDVPVRDCYSSQEMGIMAIQCPDGTGYHVQSESILLEVLDSSGAPCKPGEIGRVVATDLHNFSTPLIRYELGDFAEVGPACSCGRGLMVLKRVLGRVRNMLTLPNGQRTWPMTGAPEFGEVVHIRQSQMIQKSLNDIEVRLVPSRQLTKEEKSQMRSIAIEKLGHPFNVEIICMEEIPRDPSGKFEDFRSEIPPASLSGSPA